MFVFVSVCTFFFKFCNNLEEEERTGCFAFIVLDVLLL